MKNSYQVKDKKLIESFESNFRMFSALKKEGHRDITKYDYWNNNPYFRNFEELEKWYWSRI